jgi:chemotaxis signal transduction protein
VSETCVLVRVADETYAVPVEHVPEVAPVGDVVPVPGAPPAVRGVRNLRGEILALVDLAAVLGLSAPGEPQRIAVVEHGGVRCGLLVDEVVDVADVEDAPQPVQAPLVRRAVLHDEALVGVLDVAGVLDALGGARGAGGEA